MADGASWDPSRDPERLASVLRRSGYSAEQFARLVDEVAVAEAREAEQRGLPGLDRVRVGVRRQTVERWTRGTTTPKGWSARFALIVMERLEATLAGGFEPVRPGGGSPLRRFGSRVRASWLAYLAALLTVLGIGFVLASSLGAGGDEAPDAPAAVALFPLGATVAQAPPVANGDPRRPSGAGCDIAPAGAWWESDAGPALADGAWFGRVLVVEEDSIVIDIACFLLDGGGGVVIEPGDADLESDRAVLLSLAPDAATHWIDGDGVRVESNVEGWLDGSGDPAAALPVPCPGGRCSAWVLVSGGSVTEVVVVDFHGE